MLIDPFRTSFWPVPLPRSRRILIVDDGPSGMFAMRRVLTRSGYEVVTCDRGSRAIEVLDSPFDLVVVDAVLPDMTGVELCRLIVERHKVPVVLRSTLAAGPGDRVAALEAGADAHLVEPFDAEVLVATVRSVLRNRELAERLELSVNMQGVGHWEWDVANELVSWTPSLEAMHGYAPGTFPGTFEAFFGCIHPEDRPRLERELASVVDGSEDRFEVAYRFLRTDRSSGHLIGRARILRGADGRAATLIGIAVDVTQRVVAARRNDQMVSYVEALMATSTLAEGGSTIRRRGPGIVGADLVDVEWTPVEDELDRGEVAPRTILRRTELDDVPNEGASGYVRLGDDASAVPRIDGDGSADGVIRLVGVYRVTTAAGTGRVAVGWKDPPELDDDDRRFLELFAGLSISGIRQLSDYERHLHIGLTLQRALMPKTVPVDGLELAFAYRPATEASLVGGDWYDAMEVRPGLVAVVIGDIAGHGIAASAAASAVRHTMRTALSAVDDLGEAMCLVDRVVSTDPESSSGTAALLLLDRAAGEARVLLAGHPPPLVRKADGATRYVEAEPYPLLGFGLWGDAAVEAFRLPIADGDIIVLYTDGAVERRDRSLDVGLGELARAVSALADPQEIVDVLVTNNGESSATSDDTIVVAVRLRP